MAVPVDGEVVQGENAWPRSVGSNPVFAIDRRYPPKRTTMTRISKRLLRRHTIRNIIEDREGRLIVTGGQRLRSGVNSKTNLESVVLELKADPTCSEIRLHRTVGENAKSQRLIWLVLRRGEGGSWREVFRRPESGAVLPWLLRSIMRVWQWLLG